jgi:hypothetical protein
MRRREGGRKGRKEESTKMRERERGVKKRVRETPATFEQPHSRKHPDALFYGQVVNITHRFAGRLLP